MAPCIPCIPCWPVQLLALSGEWGELRGLQAPAGCGSSAIKLSSRSTVPGEHRLTAVQQQEVSVPLQTGLRGRQCPRYVGCVED